MSTDLPDGWRGRPGAGLRGYAICGEQRTGSSYLCQLLASTGVLGRPMEYFHGRGMAVYQPAYPQEPEDQLREVVGQGATENGVYGVKLFSATFDQLAEVRWTERLPNLHFVWLTRRDLLGQAISFVRAAQTGQFASVTKAECAPVYDAEAILHEIRRLACGQARWEAFFARCGLTPLRLEYEQIVADPQHAASAVARFLGLEEEATIDPAQVQTRMQRDATSDAWRSRFVAENGDPSHLDDLLPHSLLVRAGRAVKRRLRRAR